MSLSVLFIAGSGAVENAWGPVLSALRKAGYSCVTTPAAANLAMAQLVYLARMTFYASTSRKTRNREHKQVLSTIARLRRLICKELSEAQKAGTISVRPQLRHVLTEFVFRDATEYLIATTNWDSAVDDAVIAIRDDASVHHIHGGARHGQLFLPTEALFDEHRKQAERTKLARGMRALQNMLRRPHRVVLYGLGLGSEDVELGVAIGLLSQDSKISEFCVVDPEYARVAERLRVLLLGKASRIPIRCYCPCDARREQPVLEVTGSAATRPKRAASTRGAHAAR